MPFLHVARWTWTLQQWGSTYCGPNHQDRGWTRRLIYQFTRSYPNETYSQQNGTQATPYPSTNWQLHSTRSSQKHDPTKRHKSHGHAILVATSLGQCHNMSKYISYIYFTCPARIQSLQKTCLLTPIRSLWQICHRHNNMWQNCHRLSAADFCQALYHPNEVPLHPSRLHQWTLRPWIHIPAYVDGINPPSCSVPASLLMLQKWSRTVIRCGGLRRKIESEAE